MLDFFSFIYEEIANIISFLDSFELIENLSLLKIFFIIILLNFAYKFLHKKGGN